MFRVVVVVAAVACIVLMLLAVVEGHPLAGIKLPRLVLD